MNMTETMFGTMRCAGHVSVADVEEKVSEGTVVAIVGASLNGQGQLILACVTAEGVIFDSVATRVKVFVSKDLRERFAEAGLIDGGGGR